MDWAPALDKLWRFEEHEWAIPSLLAHDGHMLFVICPADEACTPWCHNIPFAMRV